MGSVSATIIDGKACAAALRSRVASGVEALRGTLGRAPGLAVVLVGDHVASAIYVRSKGKATRAAGMASFEHLLPAEVAAADLLALIDQLNADPAVDGILVQLPLPPHIDERAVIARIDPDKDVDGFHPINVGRLATGLPGFVPCTPLGCLKLIHEVRDDLAGLAAVVIGRSNIVGKPMAQLLIAESCTVTVVHSRTRDTVGHVRRADIVVAAVGIPALVTRDWIKPGATVIDVGINRTEHGLIGDVDLADVREVAGAITPVPGGVGPAHRRDARPDAIAMSWPSRARSDRRGRCGAGGAGWCPPHGPDAGLPPLAVASGCDVREADRRDGVPLASDRPGGRDPSNADTSPARQYPRATANSTASTIASFALPAGNGPSASIARWP